MREKTWAFAKSDKFSGIGNRFVLDVRKTCRYDVGITISSAGDTAMAKLEELMTPSELVAAIRDGAAKDELVKQYRASEQALAMMLLPLYRRGEFTKEEFNNFFKGIPIKREDETRPPDAARRRLRAADRIRTSVGNSQVTFTGSGPIREWWGYPSRFRQRRSKSSKKASFRSQQALTNVLDVILAKVTSIDIRLSEIEKKLDSR